MRCALINTKTGIVENLIVADSSDPVEDGYILIGNIPDRLDIGDSWTGTGFIHQAPEPEPLPTISQRSKPADIEGLETL